jgi:chemotaxis signal transduction protein
VSTTERRSRFTAAQLRADFDASFVRAHGAESPPQLDLLIIRTSDQRYALELTQVAALHADRKLTEAPSPRRELLGLVGMRGSVAPVYDLRFLLGYEPGSAPRWFALVTVQAPFAVAFDHFEQHLRLPTASLAPVQAEASAGSRFARGSVTTSHGELALLDLFAIFRDLTQSRRAERAPERGEERR